MININDNHDNRGLCIMVFLIITGGDISLSSTAALDYNLQTPPSSFNVTIGVRDNLQSGLPQSLIIDLLWVNQKPAYSPNEYFVTIPEHCGYVSIR
jgi:hypothetical protein